MDFDTAYHAARTGYAAYKTGKQLYNLWSSKATPSGTYAMPRGRRPSRRGRGRKRARRSRRTGGRSVAKLNRIVRAIMPEKKHWDFQAADIAPVQAGVLWSPYRAITHGTPDGYRTGDEISVRTIRFKSVVYITQDIGPRIVRIIAFICKSNQDGTYTPAQLLSQYLQTTPTNPLGTTYAPLAFRDYSNASNFKTLYDRTRLITPGNLAADTTTQHLWHITLHPRGHSRVQYTDDDPVVDNVPSKNELFLAFIADANNVGCYFQARMTYYDS